MSTKMFNKKSAMIAGTALTAGLAVGAVQSQNIQTVNADSVEDTQSNQNDQAAQTDLQTAQANYNKQKEIVNNASSQAQNADQVASQSKAKLDEANQNVTNLEQDGDVNQTKQNIAQDNQNVTAKTQEAQAANDNAAAHQNKVASAQSDYDQAANAQKVQASKTDKADQAASEAQSKIDQKQATKLQDAHTDAKNKLDQDQKDYDQTDLQAKKDSQDLADAQSKIDGLTKTSKDASDKLTVANKANDDAQQAKSDKLGEVSKKQLAYDQEFGKNGTLGILEKQVNGNLDYENSVNLPFTRDELRAAYNQDTDQGWDAIVKASETAFNQPNNQFKSESKDEDNELVDPKNLTPAQERELSEYTLRLINNARSQLNLPKWTYGLNTQSLANDIATDYDAHGRSNRQGHYVEGIVREAAKHGLKINGNAIEDLYAFYAPADKPMTMTQVKEELYNNLKGMMLGNVCNPGSDPEYHHANDLLGDQSASYALSLSNQPEDGQDFVSTHFINVTSGQHKTADGGTVYTGVADVSKANGGTWEVDPDADQTINDQIAQLKQKGTAKLTELNGLKQELASLNQNAVNAQLAATAAQNAYDQAAQNLKNVQDEIASKKDSLDADNGNLAQLKQDLAEDKANLAAAKAALDKFNKENAAAITDYQAKAATAQQEHATLATLTNAVNDKQSTLDQVKNEQVKLDQIAANANEAIENAKQTLAKHESHLQNLLNAIAAQKNSQNDYLDKSQLANDLAQKLVTEEANLEKAEANLTQAQKLASTKTNNQEVEDGDSEVVLPGKTNTENGKGKFVVSDSPIFSNISYSVKGDSKKEENDNSERIILKNNSVNINNSFNQTAVKKIYVPARQHNPKLRISLYDDHGQATGQTVAPNTTWNVYQRMLIGSQWYYQIAPNKWIPIDYVQTVNDQPANLGQVINNQNTAEQIFRGIAHVFANAGMIPLLDANGNFTGKYINPNTSWKVWAIKWVNGEELVRIGTQKQWISAKYIDQMVQD